MHQTPFLLPPVPQTSRERFPGPARCPVPWVGPELSPVSLKTLETQSSRGSHPGEWASLPLCGPGGAFHPQAQQEACESSAWPSLCPGFMPWSRRRLRTDRQGALGAGLSSRSELECPWVSLATRSLENPHSPAAQPARPSPAQAAGPRERRGAGPQVAVTPQPRRGGREGQGVIPQRR